MCARVRDLTTTTSSLLSPRLLLPCIREGSTPVTPQLTALSRKMSAISLSKFPSPSLSPTPPSISPFPALRPSLFSKSPSHLQPLSSSTPTRRTRRRTLVFSKPSEEADVSAVEEDECLKKLPEKKKPLYSHSLPCIEGWLKQLGFHEICALKALWLVEKPEWHAQLSLDVTDLYIRYLKTGPGNLEKDVERRFSYALSREDIENAILGGP